MEYNRMWCYSSGLSQTKGYGGGIKIHFKTHCRSLAQPDELQGTRTRLCMLSENLLLLNNLQQQRQQPQPCNGHDQQSLINSQALQVGGSLGSRIGVHYIERRQLLRGHQLEYIPMHHLAQQLPHGEFKL